MNENYSFRLTFFFIAFDLVPARDSTENKKEKSLWEIIDLELWNFLVLWMKLYDVCEWRFFFVGVHTRGKYLVSFVWFPITRWEKRERLEVPELDLL